MLTVRLMENKGDIEDTLPLDLAAHKESRYRRHRLDPERRRHFLADRFLSDGTHHGFLIARHNERPVGAMMCLAQRLYYTDVTVASCLLFHVLAEIRRTLLGGRVAVKLLDAGRRWALNRNAEEWQMHVTSGIHIGRTDRLLRRFGFHQTGGNYVMGLRHPSPR